MSRNAFQSSSNDGRRAPLLWWFVLLSIGLGGAGVQAALDLRNATRERLENGLTLIVLEDRNFPVVSVQMLYRVGARNEVSGQTGLAHFLEHMAFRDSENFPDTGLVSSIYARGGEWHGYTWTDQTTYFATVPKEYLDLLLRIEADRMARLIISPDDMDAERGAVLAEMHMYENDPSSMLIDAVMFASFLAHPYRNNTIGWESDIENLRHADVVDFYRRNYHPANAVLAVVGDIDGPRVRARIQELFGSFQGKAPTPLPHTREPLQTGERRVRIGADTDTRKFVIGYRAPAANSPEFAAFLVLQALLGASSGVNFLQNDWGTPVDAGDLLHGAAVDLTTWYPPSAQDYLFIIGGSAAPSMDETETELEMERRVAQARQPADDDAMSAAIDEVLEQLVYDLESTEDAAHQLAFFAGLDALDSLLELPDRVAAVSAVDVQRVAAAYLLPERRSIAWYAPPRPTPGPAIEAPPAAAPGADKPNPAVDNTPLPPPVVAKLSGGIPVIVQQSDLSASTHVQVVLPAGRVRDARNHDPIYGYSSLAVRTRPENLTETLLAARAAMSKATPEPDATRAPSADPEARLEQVFLDTMDLGTAHQGPPRAPALIVLSGDVAVDQALGLLEEGFGGLRAPPKPTPAADQSFAPGELTVRLGRPVAQARLGYIVPAPGPREGGSDAYRLLLYILSHHYEGRLGKAAISNRGLAYYIGSEYRSDGVSGWITLAIGVDPEKIDPLRKLMQTELAGLARQVPTGSEIDEAKAHLIGRRISAAQSNEELAAALAKQFLWYGEIQTAEALQARLARVSRQDVLDAVPGFINGTTIIVRE